MNVLIFKLYYFCDNILYVGRLERIIYVYLNDLYLKKMLLVSTYAMIYHRIKI
jgi:hypothetical protein